MGVERLRRVMGSCTLWRKERIILRKLRCYGAILTEHFLWPITEFLSRVCHNPVNKKDYFWTHWYTLKPWQVVNKSAISCLLQLLGNMLLNASVLIVISIRIAYASRES